MVKKYFRPFILAAALSVSMGAQAPMMVLASEPVQEQSEKEPDVPDDSQESEQESESEDESESESESESENDSENESEEEQESEEIKDNPDQTPVPAEQAQSGTAATQELNVSTENGDNVADAGTAKAGFSFSYDGIRMESEGVLKEGATVHFYVSGLKGTGVKNAQVQITAPEGYTLKIPEQVSGEGYTVTGTASGNTGTLSLASETGAFSQDGEIQIDATVGAEEGPVSFTVTASDMEGKEVFNDTKAFDVSFQEEARGTGASLSFDSDSYGYGDQIYASMDGLSVQDASSAEIVYNIPAGTSYSSTYNPVFENASVEIQYQNSAGEWGAGADTVKAVRAVVTPNGAGAVTQTSPFVVVMKAEDSSQADSTVITNVTYSDGSSEQYENSAKLNIKADAVTVSMSQTPETPNRGADVTQHITASFVRGASSYFVYRPDQAVTVKTLHADGFLKGAGVEIIHADGTASAELSEDLDLSGYKGITEIRIKPASDAKAGTEAAFDVILNVGDVKEYTCTAEAVTGAEGAENHISSSLTSKVSYTFLERPSLAYENAPVAFGNAFVIGIYGMEMEDYSGAKVCQYTMEMPAFVTTQTLSLPSFDRDVSIQVIVTADGQQSDLGSFEPGSVVKIGRKISGLQINVTSKDGFKADIPAVVTMENSDKSNKETYFAFRAKASYDGVSLESNIAGITFENYKKPEPTPEPTKPPVPETEPSTEPSTPSNPSTPSGNEETEPETETDSAFDDRREEEEKRKEQAKNDAILREQKSKETQKSLLADRIAEIRDTALAGGGSSFGSLLESSDETEDEESQFNPIPESIISNLIPDDVLPISEDIISNIIKTDA